MTTYGTLTDQFQVSYGTANAVPLNIGTHAGKHPHLQAFDVDGTVATDCKPALTLALTDFATVYMGGTYILATDFTIASGKTVVLLPGASLTIASAKTLTVASGGVLVKHPNATLTVTGTLTLTGKKYKMLDGGDTNLAALTENSGAIGGTNDGNLPTLVTTANATYSQNESTALNGAIREVANRVNQIITALTA